MILFADLPAPTTAPSALQIELPGGLIGLRHLTRFQVEPIEGSWPFVSFRAQGDEEWSFVAIEPGGVIADYAVELSDEDTDALELSAAEDAFVFNIVTVHSAVPQHATANLIGPIVVNRRTLVGRQVIIANSDRYSTHYTLADERVMEHAA